MARYTEAVCRQCRREGQKLFLKGEKCTTDKCPISKREYAPGQHGQNRKKISEYGLQHRAKMKTRRYYGVLEGQFYHYFELAEKKQGQTGENLLKILESRLDNVVYRMGLASSRAQARQFVVHGHYTVDGKKVNIPSYLVKEGQVVALSDKSKTTDSFKTIVEANSGRPVPMWLDMDKANLSAKVERLPNREEIDLEVEETLIVELYSK
ncbi:MAG: 30S ribosomal protein S4 [Oscillospiraceae bacterium]